MSAHRITWLHYVLAPHTENMSEVICYLDFLSVKLVIVYVTVIFLTRAALMCLWVLVASSHLLIGYSKLEIYNLVTVNCYFSQINVQ